MFPQFYSPGDLSIEYDFSSIKQNRKYQSKKSLEDMIQYIRDSKIYHKHPDNVKVEKRTIPPTTPADAHCARSSPIFILYAFV